jgi:hypothetical protein
VTAQVTMTLRGAGMGGDLQGEGAP